MWGAVSYPVSALDVDVKCALRVVFALSLQLCGDVRTLQYITIEAAKAAAERFTGQPVTAPVSAALPRDLRSAPRARPVPRAASAVPAPAVDPISAADPDSTAATPNDNPMLDAAAATGSAGARAAPSQPVPVKLGSGAPHAAPSEVSRGLASLLDPASWTLPEVCPRTRVTHPSHVSGPMSPVPPGVCRFASQQ